MHVNSVGIQVRYTSAESTRKWLIKHQALDTSLEFIRDKDFFTIPVSFSLEETKKLISSYSEKSELLLGEFTFEKKTTSPKNLYDAVSLLVPNDYQEFIPKAYDVIGEIAIIDIPKEIIGFKTEIGNALLSLFPSITTVYRKASAVSGLLRIRELELIAGEEKCITEHHEHSVRIFVNVCKTYFSPRLSNEHKRVADRILKGEIVVDMFAGVGPFSLHIAKQTEAKIYAIDINKTAIENLDTSVTLNKLKGEIISFHGNCRDILNKIPQADKVIMNLPSKSGEYLDVACKIIKPKGIIYFYHFVPDKNPEERIKKILDENLQLLNWKIEKVISFQKVRESAPHEIQACLEVSIVPV